jgi:hypothetical protein
LALEKNRDGAMPGKVAHWHRLAHSVAGGAVCMNKYTKQYFLVNLITELSIFFLFSGTSNHFGPCPLI